MICIKNPSSNKLIKYRLKLRSILAATLLTATQSSADITSLQKAFIQGDYEEVLDIMDNEFFGGADYPTAKAMEIRSLLAYGLYTEARYSSLTAIRRSPNDPQLILAVFDALRANGLIEEADQIIQTYLQSHTPTPTYKNVDKPVYFAEVLIAGKADEKKVLSNYFQRIRADKPKKRVVYRSIGNLALRKHDRRLAAEAFGSGLKHFPTDPELLLGMYLCRVNLPEDLKQEGIETYLDLALAKNPNSNEALFIKANDQAQSKRFEDAKDTLKELLELNPSHPEAWALTSAIARLQHDEELEIEALENAKELWSDNPEVPFTMGKSLAAHYRFAPAISYLKEALKLDPDNPSILFELASNQIRFGEYEQGWKNIEASHKLDPYNVAAFNLITLRDKIKDYPALEKDGVIVRMSPEDAAVFGQHALDLAVRSKNTLTQKYGVTLTQPVTIEILPRQADFAIRTLGLPGGEAFLGVCFGPLITMTSPRGRLGRNNWETVLWHEMAHTITLEATEQRIPRWLTEGISVYEERQVKEGWGQGMNSIYRKRFIDEEMPDIIDLDESFQGPDILFGYYHASLVVEYYIYRFGMDKMQKLLAQIRTGSEFKTALTNITGLAINKFEGDFRVYAQEIAIFYGHAFDWTPLTDEEFVEFREDPQAWVTAHPTRYQALSTHLSQLITDSNWEEAKTLAKRLIEMEPNNREAYNPYWALSLAHKALLNPAEERAALTEFLRLDSDAAEASDRLLQLSDTLPPEEQIKNAIRVLETNPFKAAAYRTMANLALESGNDSLAKSSHLSLIGLNPLDVSRLHYQLATILKDQSPMKAKRHILQALEKNPRFIPALKLLKTLPAAP